MARRFNFDLDMDLALEGYAFETFLRESSLDSPNFNTIFTPLSLFTDYYVLDRSFNSLTPKDETPLDAPQTDQPLNNSPFGAVFELSSLLAVNGGDGSLGFVINGLGVTEFSGSAVSGIGDVNNDGIDDFAIGATLGDSTGSGSVTGETYVIFGQLTGFSPEIDLLSLDGTNGFIITGTDNDGQSGRNISAAGDINGDGIDDILISDQYSDVSAYDSGQGFVVFGSDAGFDPFLSLEDLDGTNGFTINGFTRGDKLGVGLSGNGDINGDGFDDIIFGADGGDNGRPGKTYVIFGSDTAFSANFDLSTLDGTNGYVINGIDGGEFSGDQSGRSVDIVGDINGDGFDDILIGAPNGDANGTNSGVLPDLGKNLNSAL